ncbi:MAG: hypothetical protein NVSMB57_02240 [Actinomycetota bacterium]
MGRMRVTVTLLLLAATCFANPVNPAHASRTIDVELFGSPPKISPDPVIAKAGDTIRFTLMDQGTHNLQRYAQAGGDTPIDSGTMHYNNQALRYAVDFGGGTVRYRCLIHSVIDSRNGVCSGMCGVITDQDTIPLPPVIDQPTRSIRESPATISGSAEPMTIITLTEGVSGTREYQGQALTDDKGRWSVRTVKFGTADGKKYMIARAVRAVGYVSDDSAVVRYDYQYDGKPPTISFDPIPSPLFLGKIHFSGHARDNVGIREVRIKFSGLQVPQTNDPGKTASHIFTLPAECQPACPALLPFTDIKWTFDRDKLEGEPLPAGLYIVSAVAVDTSGNPAEAQAPTYLGYIAFANADGPARAVYSNLPDPVKTIVPYPSPNVSPVVPVIPTSTPT